MALLSCRGIQGRSGLSKEVAAMVWKFLNLHKLLDALLEELFDDDWLAPLASGVPDRGGSPPARS